MGMIMERGSIWTGWRNVLYRRQYLVVVVLACLGITLSVISFKFVLGQEEHKQRVAFEHAAATATGALKHSLHMHPEYDGSTVGHLTLRRLQYRTQR